jgi:hypothetical protein
MLKKDAGPDLQHSHQLFVFDFLIHCSCLQDTQSPHLLAVCLVAEPLHQSPELCQGIYAHSREYGTVLNDLQKTRLSCGCMIWPLDRRHIGRLREERHLADGRGGKGVEEEEPIHTSARKPGPL